VVEFFEQCLGSCRQFRGVGRWRRLIVGIGARHESDQGEHLSPDQSLARIEALEVFRPHLVAEPREIVARAEPRDDVSETRRRSERRQVIEDHLFRPGFLHHVLAARRARMLG
jgi:hypothetical protein